MNPSSPMTDTSHPSDSPDVVALVEALYEAAVDYALDKESAAHPLAGAVERGAVGRSLEQMRAARDAALASLTQLQEERDDLLGRLAVMFPLSGWADRHRALSSPSSLPREGANG